MNWPPSDQPRPATDPATQPGPRWPPAGWPSLAQVQYIQSGLTVLLMLAALPLLARKVVRSPEAVLGVPR